MLEYIQEFNFSYPELPILGKCKSEGFIILEPFQLKRKLSDFNIESFDPMPVAKEEPIEINEDWILFPELDILSAFEQEIQPVVKNIENIEEIEENPFADIDLFDQPVREFIHQNPRKHRKPKVRRKPLKNEPEPLEIFALFDDIEYLDREAYFINQLKDSAFFNLEAFDPYYIKCNICICKQPEYDSLGCDHKFCVSCIKLYINTTIEACKVMPEDLACPECSAMIPDSITKKFITFEAYEKMLVLRLKIKYQLLAAQGKAVACPVPDCPGFAHILEGEKITACNKCRCTLCCLCKLSVHPGITCEENMKESRDSALESLILSQNWKKCPTCGVPVEKVDGCQFLYCSSPICRGKNNLCYLCGRFVVEDQHFAHYKTKGPYGDTCNTLDGIPEDIDSTKLVPLIHDPDDPNAPPIQGEEE